MFIHIYLPYFTDWYYNRAYDILYMRGRLVHWVEGNWYIFKMLKTAVEGNWSTPVFTSTLGKKNLRILLLEGKLNLGY